PPPTPPPLPYTTLFRSRSGRPRSSQHSQLPELLDGLEERARPDRVEERGARVGETCRQRLLVAPAEGLGAERERGRSLAQSLLRSEEHTSELQSLRHLV